MLSFTSCHEKQKVKINNKVQEVYLQRDLLGRMLTIPMEEQSSKEKKFLVLDDSYAYYVWHLDGMIYKTNKSAMIKIQRNDTALPTSIDVVIVDVFSFTIWKMCHSCSRTLNFFPSDS